MCSFLKYTIYFLMGIESDILETPVIALYITKMWPEVAITCNTLSVTLF